MTTFAQGTAVPVERSRAEVERLLTRYGCSQFQSGWDQEHGAHVAFRFKGTAVMIALPMPAADSFTKSAHGRRRTKGAAEEAWKAEQRRRWRALVLIIKAKLEAVTSGISSFEREFLADITLPNGRSIGDALVPQIAEIQNGRLQLPAPE